VSKHVCPGDSANHGTFDAAVFSVRGGTAAGDASVVHNLLFHAADARFSLIGFSVATPIFVVWVLTFSIGYDKVFSKNFVRKLDCTRLNLQDIGWYF
jgi:hypothetical protein